MAINTLELCEISPSQDASPEQLLPLLYFDILWLPVHLMQIIFFYDFQCSQSHFLETVVPNLKNSLSLTLKHFLPLAGKIVFRLTSEKTVSPVSHYVSGDSVSLTIAVSNSDFFHLTGNLARDADEFHHFLPQIPPPTHSTDVIKFSVIAIQVTLFPNQGISIGITYHHAICDGANLFDFMHKWASINKFNGDAHLGEEVLPFYNRSVVQDAEKFTTIDWIHQMKKCRPSISSAVSLPTYRVRCTFFLSELEIKALKNSVMKRKPAMARVSSFTVICGYVWSCLVKSAAAAGEEVSDDEAEYLSFPADCRKRLSPPLPDTYFGNCLVPVRLESTHGRLKGNEGFVAAAQAIGEAIYKTLELRIIDWEGKKSIGKRVVRVASSPRMDPYGADYGWGRPKKFECVHIDCEGAFAVCKSREEGLEIGLSLPKVKMDAFAAIFNKNMYINSNL